MDHLHERRIEIRREKAILRDDPCNKVTLQQVYRCAIDPELFAAKIEAAEKLSDDLNTGAIFIKADALAPLTARTDLESKTCRVPSSYRLLPAPGLDRARPVRAELGS